MTPVCGRCGRQIFTAWRTAKGNFYHPHCFTCAICDIAIESEHQLDACNLKEIYCNRCHQEYFVPIGEDAKNNAKIRPTTPTTMIPSNFLMEGDTSVCGLLMKESHQSDECSVSSSNSAQIRTEDTKKHLKMEVDNNKSCDEETQNQKSYSERRIAENLQIAKVIESTKPAAFFNGDVSELWTQKKLAYRPEYMQDLELSRNAQLSNKMEIPKRSKTAKPYSSHSEFIGSEFDNSTATRNAKTKPKTQSLDQGLNKFFPPKPTQNLVRGPSFNIPQQIKSKMNDYINSKGLKFSKALLATPPVTPKHSQHRSQSQQQTQVNRKLPLKAYFCIPPSDAKKMSKKLKNVTSKTMSLKGTDSSSSGIIPKSQSKMSTSVTVANSNSARMKSSSTNFTPQVQAEKKLSNFKMPSFVVPIDNFKISPTMRPDPVFSQGIRSPQLSHYILPHEIMSGMVKQTTAIGVNTIPQLNDRGCGPDSDNDTKTQGMTSTCFGNTTLPRPIPRKLIAEESTTGLGSAICCRNANKCLPGRIDLAERNLDCPICMEKLVNLNSSEGTEECKSQENVVTCCGHIFHKECIHRWLSTDGNDRCPTCSKLCLKESMIPVYIEANIADNLNIKDADNDELKALLHSLRADYKQLKEKYYDLVHEHGECGTRFAITDSLRSAYEIENRTRCQLQWENKRLHQKLQEFRAMVTIEQGDNFENSLSDNK